MKYLSLIMLFFGLVACAESQESTAKDTYSDAVLIDVRTPQEFKQYSPEGSINIPVDNIASNEQVLPQNKDTKIVVFCLSGGRSSHAKFILEEMGYKNVINGGTFRNVAEVLEQEKELKKSKG